MSGVEEDLRRTADQLRRATGVFVLTGAGISAESGVPTFRGAGGLWRRFRAEDLASPEGFARDPALVWEWYNERRRAMREARPNAAHRTLARWDERFSDFLIATQNIDGLHQRGGARRVVELHGSIWRARCTKTGKLFRIDEEVDVESTLPPPSPAGGGAILRPDIVWFGETLPPQAVAQVERFFDEERFQIAFVIGTSAAIGYIQVWIYTLARAGVFVVEVNPDPCLGGAASATLAGPAGELLPRLDSLAWPCAE